MGAGDSEIKEPSAYGSGHDLVVKGDILVNTWLPVLEVPRRRSQ